MGQFYFSIKPFGNDAGTVYADDFIDVTPDVIFNGIGGIDATLDNNDFEVGVFKHKNFNLKLLNFHGKYSEIGTTTTIFRHARGNSIVKVEWEINPEPRPLGFFPAGEFMLSPRQTVGTFLLKEDTLAGRAQENNVKFTCLAFTTLFDGVVVPFGGAGGDVQDGDLFSVAIFKILNQTHITDLLTVTQANIVTATDVTIDDKTLGDLENKTGTQALKKILKYANSVLTIVNDTVFVSNRDPSADVKFTFRGVGSVNGTENIIDIAKDRSGRHRIINFAKVKDSSIFAQDGNSIDDFEVRDIEIDLAFITGGAKQQSAVNAIVAEFANPKRELVLITPLNYDILDLNFLDRVKIDLPPRLLQRDGADLPFYEVAEYEIAEYPDEILDIEISILAEFKITAIRLDPRKEIMALELRRIN